MRSDGINLRRGLSSFTIQRFPRLLDAIEIAILRISVLSYFDDIGASAPEALGELPLAAFGTITALFGPKVKAIKTKVVPK